MIDSEDILATFGLLNALPLEQQVRLLRQMFDLIPDAVMVHGPDGDLVFWSEGVCDLLGYDRGEIAGFKPFGWVEPSAMRGAPSRLEAILHDGSLAFESRAVRKDGTVIPTHVTARRLDTRVGPLILAVIRDISSLKSAEEQLAYLANSDVLTGVANRQSFEKRLILAAADARRHGDHFAVAYVDIDDLKHVNESLGSAAGDCVLQVLAARLASCLREQDIVARLGADEFAILLSRMSSPNDYEPVAARILSAMAEKVDAHGVPCSVTASVGFAALDLADDDPRAAVLRAETAMRDARSRKSGGSWAVWTPDPNRGDERGA